MKTSVLTTLPKLLALELLGASAALDQAGPGPQFWNRAKPVTTTQEAAAIKPGDTMVMVCGKCKTVAITEFTSGLPNGKGTPRWMQIGTRHECESCGGTITVVKGKTTDSMQHNCSKCGEGAAFCCSAPAKDAGAKK